MSGFRDSTHHARPRWYWWIVIIGTPLVLVFGTIGYRAANPTGCGLAAWADALYRAMHLFLLRISVGPGEVNGCIEFARWLAALIFGIAVVGAFVRITAEEYHLWRLARSRGHVVICGMGPRVLHLARCFRSEKHTRHVVIVAASAGEDEVAACRAAGVTLVFGTPADPPVLTRARAHRAGWIIALCPDDSVNVQIAIETRRLVMANNGASADKVRCFVHLSAMDLRSALQNDALFGGSDPRFELRFFDLFDAAARRLLLDPRQLPLDRGGIREDDPRQVHLVILGFGRMGRSVALRAAQLGHFANRKRLRISVMDREAARHEQALLFRYPNFRKACDIEFHQCLMESVSARQLLEKWCEDAASATSMAVCFDQDSLALEVALRLQPLLEKCGVPMAVRLSRASGFGALLGGGDLRARVCAFGMVEDRCAKDVIEDPVNEELARTIHDDFRRKREERIRAKGGNPSADPATLAWENLDEGLRESNRQQADHIGIKLHAIGCERVRADDPRPPVTGFSAREIELLAEMEHNRWNAERWLAGWDEGPSDKPRKKSPYLVSWSKLEDDIKKYDRDAVELIPILLERIGEKVCRRS